MDKKLSVKIEDNISVLLSIFDRCTDLVVRELKVSADEPIKACLFYIDGLADTKMISAHMLRASQLNPALIPQGQHMTGRDALNSIKDYFLEISEVTTTGDLQQIVDHILAGDIAFLLEGSDKALIAGARGWEARKVEEPQTEPLVRGPREGFTENLRTNTALIRRRLKTPRLKMEPMTIGRLSKTAVVIAYIEGIANDKVVEEVRRRLGRIDIDGVMGDGYLEELIEDQPFTIFPQVHITERPDKAAANLLEGYVAIILDNTPMVMIVPCTFMMFLQSTEDYYSRFTYATFIRFIRFLALNFALLLPAVYISVITFHQELLPSPLLFSIASEREGTPFPAFVEALLMESIFEILREAGIRLPRPIGQAISIVGALVIGTAAVDAGLVSPGVVIVVALTAISSFTIPSISGSLSIRLLRFPIMFLAAGLGLFGVMVGLMGLLIHLSGLRSFGVPYLSPFAPTVLADLKDSFIRVPWWAMRTRPRLIGYRDLKREPGGQRPGPSNRPPDKLGKGGGDDAGKG